MYAKKPNIQFPICTVGLYVSLCLMIFLCPFLHCKVLRTQMYKRYINSIIIIIIIIIKFFKVKSAPPMSGGALWLDCIFNHLFQQTFVGKDCVKSQKKICVGG